MKMVDQPHYELNPDALERLIELIRLKNNLHILILIWITERRRKYLASND